MISHLNTTLSGKNCTKRSTLSRVDTGCYDFKCEFTEPQSERNRFFFLRKHERNSLAGWNHNNLTPTPPECQECWTRASSSFSPWAGKILPCVGYIIHSFILTLGILKATQAPLSVQEYTTMSCSEEVTMDHLLYAYLDELFWPVIRKSFKALLLRQYLTKHGQRTLKQLVHTFSRIILHQRQIPG